MGLGINVDYSGMLAYEFKKFGQKISVSPWKYHLRWYSEFFRGLLGKLLGMWPLNKMANEILCEYWLRRSRKYLNASKFSALNHSFPINLFSALPPKYTT